MSRKQWLVAIACPPGGTIAERKTWKVVYVSPTDMSSEDEVLRGGKERAPDAQEVRVVTRHEATKFSHWNKSLHEYFHANGWNQPFAEDWLLEFKRHNWPDPRLGLAQSITKQKIEIVAASEEAPSPIVFAPARTRAFISYSHQDKKYLERLHVHLKHYERMGTLDVWDDTKIAAGAKWREEIKAAIRSAKVAILLISADFLASDFVAEKELPPLLAAAQDEGAIIIPVILKPCAFEDSELSQFQAVENARPLIHLSPGRREEVWTRVARLVREALKTAEVHAKGSDSA